MFSVEDSIDGSEMVVVCGAAQLPLPLDAGRWAVGRMVRQQAGASEGSRVLRTVHESTAEQTWWVGDDGIAVAAAVDAWAAGRTELGALAAVAVPFDARVYLARLEDGLVSEEWVLAGDAARKRAAALRAETGRLLSLDVGGRSETVADLVENVVVDLDLDACRLQPMSVLFAKRGLFHPLYPLALALLLGLAAAGWLYWEQGRLAAAAAAAESMLESVAAGEMIADFGGAAKLEAFAGMLGEDALVALHREGLDRAEYVPAQHTVRMRGVAAGFVPGAREYARAWGGEFVMAGASWEVVRAVGSVPDSRSVEGIGIEAVAGRLFGLEAQGASVTLSSRAAGERTVMSRFVVGLAAPTAFDLAELARRLQGEPVALDKVECKYARWVMESCDVELTAKGVPGE